MNTYYGVSAWQWQSGSDYLAHHGILGQKWGKRNGPPYPLSAGAHSSAEKRLKNKNEGKLESWRAKESKRIDKKYSSGIKLLERSTSRAVKRYDETKKKYEGKPSNRKQTEELERLKNDITRQQFGKLTLELYRDLEKKAVMQMTLDDISDERKYVGKQIAKDTLTSVGSVALSAFARTPVAWIQTPSIGDEKTKYRLSEMDKRREERKQEFQKQFAKKANDNYNKVMLLTAKGVHPFDIASRTGLNLDQIHDYKRGGFGELTPKVKSWVDYSKEAEDLTRKFTIPMDERVEVLMRKNKLVDRYADEHGVNTRNIPKYIKLTGDPELKRLYEAYKDERNKLDKKYPGKMDKWT